MRIWTYKNEDEKAHTFSRRSKNVKKRTKTDEKRMLCKFTLIKLFLKKNAKFSSTGGSAPRTSRTSPHSELLATHLATLYCL